MTHIWTGSCRPDRIGQPCQLEKAHRGKFLLRFADGLRLLTVRGNFRRIKPEDEKGTP